MIPRQIPILALAAGLVAAIAAAQPPGDPPDARDTLSLADALALALTKSPALDAYSLDIRAAEARQIQARLRPNPDLEIQAESIRLDDAPDTHTRTVAATVAPGGLAVAADRARESGAPAGLSEAEFTIGLSQLVELGGKRARRIRLAQRGRDVAAWDYEIARANLVRDVTQNFVDVLAAQRRADLDDDLVRLAEEVSATVSARVEAGRVSPLEQSRAQTRLAAARVEAAASRNALAAARARLAALWGAREPDFTRAEGDLDAVGEVPALPDLARRIAQNPDLARWRAELAAREAALALERANAVPDLTVAAGFRLAGTPESHTRALRVDSDGISAARGSTRAESDWDHSLVLGVSIPLPLFNRNQGSIREAAILAEKAAAGRRAADAALHANLAGACNNLDAALAAINALKNEILPTAAETYDSVNEGYRQGKFSYLDVLDAEQTLFDARRQYLDALAQYHRNLAEIQRIAGEPQEIKQ